MKAVIVDPFSSGAEYAPAFATSGIPSIAVLSRPEPPAVYLPSYCPDDFEAVLTLSDGFEPLRRRLAELQPACVLPGADSGVTLADRLAAALTPARANLSALAAARRHKGTMMQALAENCVPVLRQICSNDVEEVADWLRQTGLDRQDIVIKPPVSASTDGVTRIRVGDPWRPVFLAQLGQVNQWDVLNETMVVQEYAFGEEYVVDICSASGTHSIANICRYTKRRDGRHVGIYDCMDWLPPDAPVADVLAPYARAALDAVGMRFGASHIEIMLTPGGPRLIEINARPHGGGHPVFCRAATGDSQVDRAVRAIAGESLAASYRLERNARVLFLISPNAGTMTNIEVLDPIRNFPSCYRLQLGIRNGGWVAATGDLLTSQAFGFAVLIHPDPAQIRTDSAKLRALESQLEVRDGAMALQ